MGVMAATPEPIERQLVRLWAVPEGVKPPNRGAILQDFACAILGHTVRLTEVDKKKVF